MLEYEVEKKSQNEFDDPEPTLADPSLEDQMTSIHRAVSDDDESEIEHDASSEIESLFANDDAEPSASTSKTTANLNGIVPMAPESKRTSSRTGTRRRKRT